MRNKVDPDALSIALAERSRRALLENLRYGQKSVTELVNATQLKQPNVSNHLAKMRQQGIVRAERIGRQVYYSLSMPFADVLLSMHAYASSPEALTITGGTQAESVHVNGLAPGGAHDQNGAHSAPETAARQRTADSTLLAEWQNSYFQSVFTGKEDQANHLVNAMLSQGLDMQTIYIEVFQWALNRVGELYQQGATDEAHEHMASAITERMMARVAHFHTPVTRAQHRAVLGCVAGNWHTLGLRMLADGLRGQGWDTIFLGANVPTASFVSMVEAMRPELVVISCAIEDQLPDLKDLIAHLRALQDEDPEQQFAVAIGGHCIQHQTKSVSALHADFSAPDLPHFLNAVRTRFAPPDRSELPG